jgi:alpha-ketoglutarate-dependent taurine dioxygenase
VFGVGNSLVSFKDDIREAVQQAGACLVRMQGIDFRSGLRQQELVFGPSLPDSIGSPFSKIAVTPGRKYYASSSVGQPLHSDDAHLASPPRLISLYCEEQALHGGFTVLAKIGDYLDANRTAIPDTCFALNAITVRSSAASLQRALVVGGNRLLCSLPSILLEASGQRTVMEFYQSLMAWCHAPENQIRLKLAPDDLLFIDNHRIVHGRTPFPKSEPRTLMRVSFGECVL